MKNKISIAGLLGFTGVALGALGAHALVPHLSTDQLASFKTGVLYQLLHAVVMLALALTSTTKLSEKQLSVTFNLLLIGVLLFSGSIYILATKDLTGISFYKVFGPITPLGGLVILGGWGFMTLSAFLNRK